MLRRSTLGDPSIVLELVLLLEFPFAVHVAALPQRRQLSQYLAQVGVGLVELALELPEAPVAIVQKQLEKLVDEFVLGPSSCAVVFGSLFLLVFLHT